MLTRVAPYRAPMVREWFPQSAGHRAVRALSWEC